MKITRQRYKKGDGIDFPTLKEPGDVVVTASGEIFCWDSQLWSLIGGRFLPSETTERFLDYIKGGWPDEQSAKFDVPALLKIYEIFIDKPEESDEPPRVDFEKIFLQNVVLASAKIDKYLNSTL